MGRATSVQQWQPDRSWDPAFPIDLLSQPEAAKRGRLIAQEASRIAGGGAVVYVADTEGETWIPQAMAGEIAVDADVVPLNNLTLGVMRDRREATVFTATDLVREHFGHLRIQRTVVSLACIPLWLGDDLVGAIECVAFDRAISDTVLQTLRDVAAYGGPALGVALAQEQTSNDTLVSINRLTQLYDIEKVFSSTLEMDDLLRIIPAKILDVFEVQAVNLWLVADNDQLQLMGTAGDDPTVMLRMLQAPGEGIATEASESGAPVVVRRNDPRLDKRNAEVAESSSAPIDSVLAVPIMDEDAVTGVLEVCNKLDAAEFDEDDEFFLTHLAEASAVALHNAQLLLSERKMQILEMLVGVSKEITSTLNLDRVLTTIVNGPSTVIPYDRAAVGLYHHGRLHVKAISGEAAVNTRDPKVSRLSDILDWVVLSEREMWVKQHGDEPNVSRPEEKAKFSEYFAETGYRGFYAMPLADDEGRVGVLSFESTDPDFLNRAHVEMINVLAAQATVALRNAQLYHEVPFINVLEPILHKKQQFMALEKRRRALMVGIAVAAVAVLAIVPFPMRVSGRASVAPVRRAMVQPEAPGIVRQVFVKEGQWVPQGAVLASMDDWEPRSALAAADAKYRTALDDMNRALSTGDSAEAGVQRSQVSYWAAEVDRSKQRLDRSQVRAPIAGYVVTPHFENFTGRRLEAGDPFVEIADSSRATVDVAVDEQDLRLVREQEKAAVKLDGFPAQTFRGRVTVVSPGSQMQTDGPVFFARVDVDNPQGMIRPGMQGYSKISVGAKPIGYVMFRGPALWLYSKLWSWFGW